MTHNANHNPVLQNLRHLNEKYEMLHDRRSDFLRRQNDGEKPDPNEFMSLLEQQATTQTAMKAQFNLIQKPLKTVLTDSR